MKRLLLTAALAMAMTATGHAADPITASTYAAIVGNCYDTLGEIDPDGDGPQAPVVARVETCFMAMDAEACDGFIVNTYLNVPTDYGKTEIVTRPIFFWVDGTIIEIDDRNRFVLDAHGDVVRIQDREHDQRLEAK